MSEPVSKSRLSLLAAAWVIARRDFTAVLFSRYFLFFLLGPLFPLGIGGLAGGIGGAVERSSGPPSIGVAMTSPDVDAMIRAQALLQPVLSHSIPEMRVLRRLRPGEHFDAKSYLSIKQGNVAAVVTGSPTAPVLTGPPGAVEAFQGDVALLSATALKRAPTDYPKVTAAQVATSAVSNKLARMRTAQFGQVILVLLIMLLAGMVLSNLVEEKANKIIEILAAAIPLDALFLGKLFAMLGVSLVGIAVWGTAIGSVVALSGAHIPIAGLPDLHDLTPPGVGWPLFFVLGVAYFSMGYLLLGSIFLAIGSLASTVREVQTMSMPVTMSEVLLFLFAAYAMAHPGEPVEWVAMGFPLSSPFAMLAHAAQEPALWPHLVALVWQGLWVGIAVRLGARLFRRQVMKSGPQPARRRKGFGRQTARAVAQAASGAL